MTCLCGRADDERIGCLDSLFKLLWRQVVRGLHIPRLLQKLNTCHSTPHSSEPASLIPSYHSSMLEAIRCTPRRAIVVSLGRVHTAGCLQRLILQ